MFRAAAQTTARQLSTEPGAEVEQTVL